MFPLYSVLVYLKQSTTIQSKAIDVRSEDMDNRYKVIHYNNSYCITQIINNFLKININFLHLYYKLYKLYNINTTTFKLLVSYWKYIILLSR